MDIQTRREKMIWKILRHERLLKTIADQDVKGYTGRGKRRADYMTEIMEKINRE